MLNNINVNDVKDLQASNNKIKTPVGVIGAGNPSEKQYLLAEEIGETLANLGLSIICGGRAGVMEAVCKGVKKGNGISIGLLPEHHLENANTFVTIPLATGIGFARNAIIACASLCVIAIGGGVGTLSEIAHSLKFGKKVLVIDCDLSVDGVIHCHTVDEVIKNVCSVIFPIK